MGVTQSFSPYDGTVVGSAPDTTEESVAVVLAEAVSAAPAVASVSPAERQSWLEAIADALIANKDELVALADSESGLGLPRLEGELGRTADQLRFYGRVARDGGYLGVTLDEATSASSRLVRLNRPIGPVAVFGASNAPFAYGVLGSDTASAIAAGNPVVVKAHPAHVMTCLREIQIAQEALAAVGAPAGTLSQVVGFEVGATLVTADEIAAVAFTGSEAGGLALWRLANERSVPIPVYAEMGTVNPVVLTAGGLAKIDAVSQGLVGSFTYNGGQFCTKPGMLFAPAGGGVAGALVTAMTAADPRWHLLTEPIARQFSTGVDAMVGAGAQVVGRVPGPENGWSADATVLSAPITALKRGSPLNEECFGPVVVVVEYSDLDELDAALSTLEGSLAGSVFGGGDDDPDVAHAVERLVGQVGRVTVGEWPTGVAWTWAQQHGGPWPATTDAKATSVGAAALDRFVRPIAFQAVPDAALPVDARTAVAADNPWQLPRRVNGTVMPA